MKRLICQLAVVVVAGFALCSCTSQELSRQESRQTQRKQVAATHVRKPVVSRTLILGDGSVDGIEGRVIFVWDKTKDPDRFSTSLVGMTSGTLAQEGYTVTERNLDVLVVISTELSLVDKMGNSLVYDAGVSATVYLRNAVDGKGPRMLGHKVFSGKGTRVFSEVKAKESTVQSIAPAVSRWVSRIVRVDGVGMTHTRFRAAKAFKELDDEILNYKSQKND